MPGSPALWAESFNQNIRTPPRYLPILIDTPFGIQYSSIETEAVLRLFLKIVGRETADE
jgi:hypothetical protein